MAQRSLFFNDTETEPKVYFAEDEARYNYLMMAGHGIAKQGDYEPYEVTPKQNMVVTVGAGASFIQGYLHEVYDTVEELELDAADPTYDRIDRIVLRFINTPTQREIRLAVKKGTPASSPVPPSITRENDVYEMSLTQILVEAGKSFIESYQITDEKSDPLVCGYSPLHNLLRGVHVDDQGLTTLPNQSYVEVINDNPNVSLGYGDRREILLGNKIEKDTQNEMSDGRFVARASGIYIIWIMIRSDEETIKDAIDTDVQIFLSVNGKDTLFPILATSIIAQSHNIWNGTTIMQLQKGDRVNLSGKTFWHKVDIPIINTWFRIAKLA